MRMSEENILYIGEKLAIRRAFRKRVEFAALLQYSNPGDQTRNQEEEKRNKRK
ncbi:MAG: hypothetical protein SF339_07280 [Blastocatellia bacterium]|nr:hypothetical protein [Blastocatellia bacterium]